MKKPTAKASAKSASRKSRDQPVRQRAKRLPAEQRKALILEEAARFFSENGFAASTRDLADRLGVRQALLYKYFASKEALIEIVFDEAFAEDWTSKWAKVVSDSTAPLAERLNTFYSHYSLGSDGAENLRLRLFLRGALDGWAMPARLSNLMNKGLVAPVVAALRHEDGLPDLNARPLLAGERELVMMLHGAMVFYSMRVNIYKGPVVSDGVAVSALFIDAYLRGVRGAFKALHDGKGAAELTAAE